MTQRVLLVVDDEENILRAVVRLLRNEGYVVLTATSGQQGLDLLEQHPVGVILSDQRMPGMTGSEFLEHAKVLRPQTVRIMLSGYTDLQSVTDAINRGAIYKFLTKPWDDELLRVNIREAFEHYELRAERDRLAGELQALNRQLAASNRGLQQRVATQGHELDQHHRLLELSREIVEHLPVGVLGVSDEGVVAVANSVAHALIGCPPGALLGHSASEVLPQALRNLCQSALQRQTVTQPHLTLAGSRPLTVHATRLGAVPGCNGTVLVLVPEQVGTGTAS
ncbi:response regulator [Sulfurivermis fontis]|jgi:response regulator RpfG family c-di-GMP phosphodiesterase|uniref:response regulator n=1 Tax=Sulfurivermis fontis TaxID=1972068 RepID=UPI000FD97F77|nr:response regulator [Sulfurivermis fontis]